MGGVNAGVSVGGVGVNISINDPVFSGSTTVTETTTVTTGGTIVGHQEPAPVGCYGARPNAFLALLSINNSTGFSNASLTATKKPTDSRPSIIL
jgi:hypothetical protein